MRRFEFSEGSSNKFWQVDQRGASLLIQWGKIGATGQSQTKDFASDAQAKSEADKLIAEKKKKGYLEVSAAAGSGATTSAPKAAVPSKDAAVPPNPKKAARAPKTDAIEPATEGVAAPVGATEMAAPPPVALEPSGTFKPDPVVVLTDEQRALREAWRPLLSAPETDAAGLLKTLREHIVQQHKVDRAWSDGKSHADEHGQAVADYALGSYAQGKAPDTPDVALDGAFAALARSSHTMPLLSMLHGLPYALDAFVESFANEWKYEYNRAGVSPAWVVRTDPTTNWDPLGGSGEQRIGSLAGMVAAADASARDAAHEHAARLRKTAALPVRVGLSLVFADTAWAAEDALEVLALKDKRIVQVTDLLYLLRDRKLLDAFPKPDYGQHPVSLLVNAGLECVGVLTQWLENQYARKEAAQALASVESVESARALITVLDKKDAAPYARAFFERRPDLGMVALGPVVASGGKLSPYAEPVLKGLLRDHPELPVRLDAALDSRTRTWIAAERTVRQHQRAAEADVPHVLVSPPWLAPSTSQGLPTLKLEVASPYVPPDWSKEKCEQRVKRMDPYSWALKQANIPEKTKPRSPEMDQLVRAALTQKNLYYPEKIAHLASDEFLLAGLRAGSLPHMPPDYLFARFGQSIWPTCVASLADNAQEVLSTFRKVQEPRLVRAIAFALDKKTLRNDARLWLEENPELASLGLLPLAFGDDKHERAAAQKALRVIAKVSLSTLEKVAGKYGNATTQAVALLLSLPTDQYPSKLPTEPKFFELEALPHLGLKDGKGDLPETARRNFITMLQLSPLDAPLSILGDVVSALEPQDAADFAWQLLSVWLSAGAPAKDAWAFWAVGHLGNDESARRLTPMIRAWPGESAHARAVVGLDVLAAIGTDVALMHLHGIAQKLKFKGLQEKAREKIDAVAEARGLTAYELADRLVPDLGLDEDTGTLTLDYGPRQFVVGFDEQLKPFVRDGVGKRLADPPKPGKGDDAENARAASEQYKTLKKDAKAVAQSQILRLELIMCAGRRFDTAAFRNFFVAHPLMIHLVRRVLWGVYDQGGKLASTFRVAEDRTFADAEDNPCELPANATLGVVHRLELDEATCAKWGQVFGDYEILQPFEQLGRAVFHPTQGELGSSVLKRMSGVTVKTGKILGLDARGWHRGEPQDAGWVWDMYKPLAGGFRAELELKGGFCVGYMEGTPAEQELGDLSLKPEAGTDRSSVSFSELAPAVFSELVRDLEALRE
jgi:predicted DNA-binding WGR domain protein